MSVSALVFMVIVLTAVWGGFAVALGVALARERRKRRAPNEGGD